MVGVEEDGGLAGRGRYLAEHGGVGAIDLEQPHPRETGGSEQRCRGFGRAAHLAGVETGGAHRGDAYQRLQVCQHRLETLVYGGAEILVIVHGGESTQPWSTVPACSAPTDSPPGWRSRWPIPRYIFDWGASWLATVTCSTWLAMHPRGNPRRLSPPSCPRRLGGSGSTSTRWTCPIRSQPVAGGTGVARPGPAPSQAVGGYRRGALPSGRSCRRRRRDRTSRAHVTVPCGNSAVRGPLDGAQPVHTRGEG